MTEPRMLTEARAIPEVVVRALGRHDEHFQLAAARIRAFDPAMLVTVARGSSDNVSEYIGRLFGEYTGLIPASLPPSMVTIARAPLDFSRALTLAVSQSGRSPDVVEPVRAARAAGSLTVALVNDPSSPLAEAAELTLPIDAGEERAVAATKTFVLSLVQGARLVAAVSGKVELSAGLTRLPEPLAGAIDSDWSTAVPWLKDRTSLIVVGRGLCLAVARETALKFKEICGLHAEAVSGAEVMHGPKALIGPHDPVFALAPADRSQEAMAKAVADLGALSDRVVVAGPALRGAGLVLPMPDAPLADLSPIVAATALYPFVVALAEARGLSPDEPRNLRKVTETL